MKSIFSFISPRNIALSIALCCIGIAPSSAQSYVRTYSTNIAGNPVSNWTLDIIDASGGSNAYSCLLQADASNNRVFLKKLDFNGNIILDKALECLGGTIAPQHVIRTSNGEYIVVGYYSDGATNRCPFAARFDANFNNLWFHYYPYTPMMYTWVTRGEVVIAKVEDDPGKEGYIISAAVGDAPSSSPCGNLTNSDINALRIDGSGTIVWNKIFKELTALTTPPNANCYSYTTSVKTIAYGNNGSGKGKYFIGGMKDKSVVWGPITYYNFYMSVDNTGNIVDPEEDFTVPSGPANMRAIYDNTSNEFVISYTMGNNGLVGFPTVSEVAILKKGYSAFTMGGLTSYYYVPTMTENYCYGICEDQTRTHYLMSGWVSNAGMGNMCIWQVDKNLAAATLHRYNINTYTMPSTGIFSVTDNSGSPVENHIMAGDRFNNNTLLHETRVISADVNDEACGFVQETVGVGTINNTLVPVSLWDVNNFENPGTPTTKTVTISSTFDDCDFYSISNNPDNYKNAIASSEKVTALKIYPTLLDEGNNTVIFDAYTEDRTTITLSIYNMEGKKMDTKTFDLDFGANRLSWTLPALLPGSYVISSISGNKDLNKTIRISKL